MLTGSGGRRPGRAGALVPRRRQRPRPMTTADDHSRVPLGPVPPGPDTPRPDDPRPGDHSPMTSLEEAGQPSVGRGPAALPAAACALIILDGWGLAPPGDGNAIALARTPVFDALWEAYPHGQLTTSGRAVGLPDGQMGNSEVGHMNLGAGAIVRQSLLVIDDAVADGSFAANDVLRAAFDGADRVHLVGLVSDGGVHSSIEHVRALIGMGHARDVVLHAFTDGRDAPPLAAADHLEALEREGGVRIGSVIGRYFAMDRDSRWDRVQLAYDLLVHGRGEFTAPTGGLAARAAYLRGETDEFIAATVVGDDDARIRPQDTVICFNFRADRMREILAALADPEFDRIDRRGSAPIGRCVTLTQYEARSAGPHPICGDRGDRRVPAARGGDREVPARHILLQRRRRTPPDRRAP
jgi:2,3-bisphosphoglycerate-independent phosphoglycerate mutase